MSRLAAHPTRSIRFVLHGLLALRHVVIPVAIWAFPLAGAGISTFATTFGPGAFASTFGSSVPRVVLPDRREVLLI